MRKRQRGFSLVEMLVVVILLAIILPAMLSSFTASYLAVKETRMLEIAKHVGQIAMERALSDDLLAPIDDIEFSSELPNFRYSQSFVEDGTGRTLIIITVRYPFLAQQREYRTVAIRYGE